MTFIRAQVVHHYFTGLPEDVSTNTLYFDYAGTMAVAAPLVVAKISAAWGLFSQYLSECIISPTEVKLYNMEDAPPRQPFDPGWGFPLNARVDDGIVEEAAVVLSFRGAPPFTARRRGRIYIGPLAVSAMLPASNAAFSRVNPPFVTALRNAAIGLMNNADGVNWLIYSPTDDAYVEVTNGWIDNTFDTQRRRGVEATLRNIYP